MSIKSRLGLFNIISVIMVLLMGGMLAYAEASLTKLYARSKIVADSLRHQGEADMIHDGLRGDVLFAIKLAREGSYARKSEAVKATRDNIETFRQLIADVGKMDVSPRVQAALKELKEPLERYTNNADRITQAAFDNPTGIEAMYAAFESDFEFLEKALAKFADVIQSEFEQLDQLAR